MQLPRDFPTACPRHRVRAFFLGPSSSAGCTFAHFVLCTGEAWVRASYWQHVGTLTCVACSVGYMFGTGLVRDLGRRYGTSYMYGDERGGLAICDRLQSSFVTVGVGGKRGCFSCSSSITHDFIYLGITLREFRNRSSGLDFLTRYSRVGFVVCGSPVGIFWRNVTFQYT